MDFERGRRFGHRSIRGKCRSSCPCGRVRAVIALGMRCDMVVPVLLERQRVQELSLPVAPFYQSLDHPVLGGEGRRSPAKSASNNAAK